MTLEDDRIQDGGFGDGKDNRPYSGKPVADSDHVRQDLMIAMALNPDLSRIMGNVLKGTYDGDVVAYDAVAEGLMRDLGI